MAVTTVYLSMPLRAKKGTIGAVGRCGFEGFEAVIPPAKVDAAILLSRVEDFGSKNVIFTLFLAMKTKLSSFLGPLHWPQSACGRFERSSERLSDV